MNNRLSVTVNRSDLLRVLERCQGVANAKTTMPILANVLIEADQSGSTEPTLKLSATDLYLGIVGSAPAAVETAGSVCLPARDLLERVKFMPDGEFTITTSDACVTMIKAKGSQRRYTLNGQPGEEFPTLPAPDLDAPVLTLKVSTLAQLINATHFSISPDETRLHLNSALVEWQGNRIRMVTTDGHRLTKCELTTETEADATMLIPLKGIQELLRLCSEFKGAAETIEIQRSGVCAFFRVGGFQFSVKLVDAQFPPWAQVASPGIEEQINVPRAALADTLKAVSVAASDRTGGVKLTVETGKLRIESESLDSGQGFDEIPIEYEGTKRVVGFNSRYMLDVLGATAAEEVEIGLSGELDPIKMVPIGDAGGELLAILMPMRI
jgi:DNA polymerase-3 subunit beta